MLHRVWGWVYFLRSRSVKRKTMCRRDHTVCICLCLCHVQTGTCQCRDLEAVSSATGMLGGLSEITHIRSFRTKPAPATEAFQAAMRLRKTFPCSPPPRLCVLILRAVLQMDTVGRALGLSESPLPSPRTAAGQECVSANGTAQIGAVSAEPGARGRLHPCAHETLSEPPALPAHV